MHSLHPADSAVLYISGADCDSCLYVPNDGTSLTMGTPYYVRVTAYNAQGASAIGSGSDDASLVAAVTPNQVWHSKRWFVAERSGASTAIIHPKNGNTKLPLASDSTRFCVQQCCIHKMVGVRRLDHSLAIR